MPMNNPYGGYLDTDQGVGANPYGGYMSLLQKQRQSASNTTVADALTQLRKLIGSMPAAQPQQGYLPPAPATSDIYAPDDYEKGVTGIESGGDYKAVNPTSGAGGRYQFIEPTWQALAKQRPDLGLTPEARTSDAPEAQQQQQAAFRALTAQNAHALKGTLGRAPTHAELYLAHFFGPGYASSVLGNRETPVDALVPDSFVKSNPWIKGLDGTTLLRVLGKKFNP